MRGVDEGRGGRGGCLIIRAYDIVVKPYTFLDFSDA